MAVEIEAKMKVESLQVVRSRLQELGASRMAAFEELNIFFDAADRALLAAGNGLRVRVKRNADTGKEKYIMTFKGPLQKGDLKSREEVEMEVQGAEEATKMLACLGFQKTLSFEKRRESWKMDGCEIELDELPHLGTYVEIEGPDDAAVMAVRQKLNLGDRALIKTGYIALLSDYLQKRGISSREIRFGE